MSHAMCLELRRCCWCCYWCYWCWCLCCVGGCWCIVTRHLTRFAISIRARMFPQVSLNSNRECDDACSSCYLTCYEQLVLRSGVGVSVRCQFPWTYSESNEHDDTKTLHAECSTKGERKQNELVTHSRLASSIFGPSCFVASSISSRRFASGCSSRCT